MERRRSRDGGRSEREHDEEDPTPSERRNLIGEDARKREAAEQATEEDGALLPLFRPTSSSSSSSSSSSLSSTLLTRCSTTLTALLVVTVVAVVASWLSLLSASSLLRAQSAVDTAASLFPVPARGRSLVLLVHSENDGQHLSNLRYFIRKAVRCWHDADYVIIINRDDADDLNATDPFAPWRLRLPALPSNARYVLHKNVCMDWGTFGWLLDLPSSHSDAVNTALYRYFFLLNSSVKGPFLPSYLEERMDPEQSVQCDAARRPSDSAALFPWFHVFSSRLSASVKLVGCTVSCEIDMHVQSYFLALDFMSLQVLWQVDGRVKDGTHPISVERDFARWQRMRGGIQSVNKTGPALTCPLDYASATRQGEVGATQAILSAGYNAVVMERFWQGVDFRLQPDVCSLNTWIGNPSALGVPLDRMRGRTEHVALVPWDVVFVKVKERLKHPHDAITQAIVDWESLAERTQRWQRNHTRQRRLVYPH